MKRSVDTALTEHPKFFKEGSVMNNLIASGIEVVWFSDMTQLDVVYGICVQREEKQANNGSLSGSGQQSQLINQCSGMVQVRLVIRCSRISWPKRVAWYTYGFSLYMLRRRKDTQMNKIKEIMEKIDSMGREMSADGSYKISIMVIQWEQHLQLYQVRLCLLSYVLI